MRNQNFVLPIFAFLYIQNVTCQINIVPNPSFEFTNSCPTGPAGWNNCVSWNNVNMSLGGGSWGTPDYFHPCGTGNTAPPSTFAGTCSAAFGNAMLGIVVYNVPYPNYREYIATPLNCSMIPGNTYTLSFWLTNGTGIKSPWTIRNIGVHFSSGPLTQSGWSVISVTPQCEITSNIISTSWVQYTFTINPTSGWNYMTIGAFRTDANNNPTSSFPNPGGVFSVYSNYFIDDVNLLAPPTSTTQLNITTNTGSTSICAGSNLTLTASGANSYTWNNSATGPTIVISPNASTNYTVNSSSSNCSGSASGSIAISVNPNPTVSVTGNTTICRGQTTTLTANGASTYSWNAGNNTSSIIVSPTVTSIYNVIGYNTITGCQSLPSSINVIVSNSLTLGITGKTFVCIGNNIVLNASGATSYTWNNTFFGSTFTLSPTTSSLITLTGFDSQSGCNGQKTFSISVSECLGINEKSEIKNEIKIYPNPTNGILNLQLKTISSGVKIEILNSIGEKVFCSEPKSEQFSFDLRDYNAGIYLIRILENKRLVEQIKFIKE